MAVSDRAIRNVFVYAVPRVAGYLLTLLTLPVLTRLLSPAELGTAALALVVPTIIVSVATLGIGSAAHRYYFEYREEPDRVDALVFTAQAWLAAVLLVSAGVMWFAREAVARLTMGDPAYGNAVFVAYLAAYVGEIVNFYQLQYQNVEKAGRHAALQVTRSALQSLGGLLLVWAFDLSYMGVVYAVLAGSVAAAVIGFVDTNRGRLRRAERTILAENLRYGAQLVPKSFTGYVNRFFDKYMLASMLSMSAVGVYSIGQTVGNALNTLMLTVWNAFQPSFYRVVFDDPEAGSREAGRLFTVFAYLVLAPMVVVILFASEITMLVAPPSYSEASIVIVLVTAALTTQAFGMFVGVQYAYTKRPWVIFPITVVGTLANVAANFTLIPRYGLAGAALGTVATYLVLNGLLAVVGQRLYRVRYEWRWLAGLYSVVCAAALLACWAAITEAGWQVALFGKAAVLLAYLTLGVAAGPLRRESLVRVISALVGGSGDSRDREDA